MADGAGGAVPELAAWEQDKENVRPLRGGRNPAMLASVVCLQRASDPEVARGLQDERTWKRADFEAKIEATWTSAACRSRLTAMEAPGGPQSGGASAGAPDPVDRLVTLWCEYAQWAAEMFPSESSEERVILERATRTLANEPRCRNDERHLMLWLRLADLHREPQEIFNFLWANEIGAGLALFYEAWASSLERQRRFGEAVELLQIGEARGARPLDRLRNSRAALLRRVRERMHDGGQGQDGRLGVEEQQPFGRPVFNTISEEEAAHLERPFERRGQQVAGLGTGRGLAAQGTSLAGTRPVLCFDEAAAGAPAHGSLLDAQADWLLPPVPEEAGHKENRRAASHQLGPGHGAGRPRGGAGGPPGRALRPRTAAGADGLSVFVDEEFDSGLGRAGGGLAPNWAGQAPPPLAARTPFAPLAAPTPAPPYHTLPLPAPVPAPAAPGRAAARGAPAEDDAPMPQAAPSASAGGGARGTHGEAAASGAGLSFGPAAPSTPPLLARTATGSSDAASGFLPRRAPGAPLREPRKPRPRDEGSEEEVAMAPLPAEGGSASSAADLAETFSGLRLRDEPPAKRPCMQATPLGAGSAMSTGEAPGAAAVAPQTPPRRPGSSCARCLFGGSPGPGKPGRSPYTFGSGRRPAGAGRRRSSVGGRGAGFGGPDAAVGGWPEVSPLSLGREDCLLEEVGLEGHLGGGIGIGLGLGGLLRESDCSRLLVFED